LNITHKKLKKRYEGQIIDLMIAFIGYVNDLNKLQQFKLSAEKFHHRLQWIFQLSWKKYVWRSCFMRAAVFIIRATKSSLVFTFSLWTWLFIHPHRQISKGVRSGDLGGH
jgi:hypothetical protein